MRRQRIPATKEQVEERIKKEFPDGATQGQVKQFLSSFKSEFEVEEREYEVKISAAARPQA
jgi:hypothetical protein